jgi:hypothetical protein
MALPKIAALIADGLNATGVRWMAIGSIAAMSYGEYRVTNDINIVLVLTGSDIEKLVAAFPIEEFDCPPTDVIALEAAQDEHGHFNLIHHETGFKADVYFAGKERLSHWALQQRQAIELADSLIWIARPNT